MRLVRAGDGVAVGRTLPGRGAWVCPTDACLAAADKRRAWPRALRGSVAPDAVARVREEIVP